MIGASLSRWTMVFFAVALTCLLAAEGLMTVGYGFPSDGIEAPETLVIVHLVAIGWLSLLMSGALFQFVPVLVSKPLRRPWLVLPALGCLAAGLAFLLAGFLQFAGTLGGDLPFLVIGGCLLPLGFALTAWILGETLWHARPLPLPARFVAVGLVALTVVALLGSLFTHLLSGLVSSTVLAAHLNDLVALHAAAGIGGWLTLSAIGVSYRLLPMFMLSPDKERATSRCVWLCGTAAFASIAFVAPVELALRETTILAFSVGGLFVLAALLFYGIDLAFFHRNRKRRELELNIQAAGGAFAALFASALLCAVLIVNGALDDHIAAIIYLLFFGWLGGLGLSQLYKIVPFLTWLECYGPVMGRKPTPRVQDLVTERRDAPWFVLYFAGVSIATGALLADAPAIFQFGAAATWIATAVIAIELVLVRRLANVSGSLRLPEGVRIPRLLIIASGSR